MNGYQRSLQELAHSNYSPDCSGYHGEGLRAGCAGVRAESGTDHREEKKHQLLIH